MKEKVLKPFEQHDAMMYFYETFLAAYDPALRERAGVYYTPAPVVDFIVRAVEEVLRDPTRFNIAGGLSDTAVRVLDPALGTGTFLARAYEQVRKTMIANDDAGLWPDRARHHLVAHFFGSSACPPPTRWRM